jgi:hypothetical protein
MEIISYDWRSCRLVRRTGLNVISFATETHQPWIHLQHKSDLSYVQVSLGLARVGTLVAQFASKNQFEQKY